MRYQFICAICDGLFDATSPQRVYCSQACRSKGQQRHQTSITRGLIRRGDAGAYGEMLVVLDLIRRGFRVYRAVSSHGPFDLIAWRADTGPILIEVKIGVLDRGKRCFRAVRETGWDRVAFVFEDGVVYRPADLPARDSVS